MKLTCKEGFTLIELLVVIAIIGILAGLMFPAITGAIESANSTKVANQAKNIATGIMSENMQRESQNDGTIWPGDSYTIYNAAGEQVKEVTGDTYGNSSEYFDDLIQNQVVETITSYGFFSGAGVRQPAGDAKLADNSDYNIWGCVAVKGGSVSGDAPFLYTRNLKPATDGLSNNETIDNKNRWPGSNETYWNPAVKPFGTSRCVYVTRGGAASQTRSKEMTPEKFWGDAKFSDVGQIALWDAH
jgi:prepilin-type N-terminal cleavage/methylation domain-containing protein